MCRVSDTKPLLPTPRICLISKVLKEPDNDMGQEVIMNDGQNNKYEKILIFLWDTMFCLTLHEHIQIWWLVSWPCFCCGTFWFASREANLFSHCENTFGSVFMNNIWNRQNGSTLVGTAHYNDIIILFITNMNLSCCICGPMCESNNLQNNCIPSRS